MQLPALTPSLAAVAAAVLLATSVAAAPRPVRVKVGNITIGRVQGQTPNGAIRFLENEFRLFLLSNPEKKPDPERKRVWPQILFEPVTEERGSPGWPRGDEALRQRLADKKNADVLAYIEDGSVGPGVRGPIVKYRIVIRPPGTPLSFEQAKATIADGAVGSEGRSAQHMFVIAYAVIDHAFRTGDFGLAAAIAGRVAGHVNAAKKWGPSFCVQELSAAIAEIGAKAKEKTLPGAVATDDRDPPKTSLPATVLCNS